MKIIDIDKDGKIKAAVDANDGYCPCLIQKSPDTVCMCKEFRDSFANLKKGESVTCRCGRYKAVNEHI